MAEPTLTLATTCPPWCDRNEPHSPQDYHCGHVGTEGGLYVHVLGYTAFIEDTAPRVHVFTLAPDGGGSLALGHEDAVSLALILEALNRKKAAALVRKAADIARAES